jgi:hypothetical protein
MFHAELHPTIDAPWLTMPPLHVGPTPSGHGTPLAYLTISLDKTPHTRVDVHSSYSAGPFTEIVMWKSLVVLGISDHAHLINPLTRTVKSIECDGYFGHLYPLPNHLLIADAIKLICLDQHANELWRSKSLAVDGVVVNKVDDNQIFGEAEQDPPRGWTPFRLSRKTGHLFND